MNTTPGELTAEELRMVQSAQLDMALRVSEIAQAAGIQCMLDFGSLLGAVRHGGFIPWDDDVDLAVPDDQFESLYRGLSVHLAPPFAAAFMPYNMRKIKIYDERILVRETSPLSTHEVPLSMDVFSIVDLRDSWIARRLGRKLSKVRYAHGFAREYSKHLSWNDPLRPGLLGLSMLPPRALAPLSRLTIASDRELGAPLGHGLGSGFGPEFFPRSVVYPLRTVAFEGVDFLGPNAPDPYLSMLYGDWRSLPPVSHRKPPHVVGARFSGQSDKSPSTDCES